MYGYHVYPDRDIEVTEGGSIARWASRYVDK